MVQKKIPEANFKVYVLKLNHRPIRDKRVTTHLFLAARAFGAEKVFYTGKKDQNVELSITRLVNSWGGNFQVTYVKNWKESIKKWKKQDFEIIHLTMYGLSIQQVIDYIRVSGKDKIIIVGGAKVPGILYELADWNVSMTSQPHSEISALSVFLHELSNGSELCTPFRNGRIRIVPQSKGKKIVKEES